MKEVNVEKFQVVGISIRTVNEEHAMANILALWERFRSENIMSSISDRISDDVYAVYTDYEGDHTEPYTMVLGCKTSIGVPTAENLTSVVLPAGKYLSQKQTGDLTQGAVYKVWHHIWSSDYPRAYQSDFEIYDASTPNPTNATFTVAIGVL